MTRNDEDFQRRSLIATLAIGLAAVLPRAAPAADPAPAPAPPAVAYSVIYDGEALLNATGGLRTGTVYLGTLRLGKHLALQPDLQYILHPGTDPTRKNALAVALRFELSD